MRIFVRLHTHSQQHTKPNQSAHTQNYFPFFFPKENFAITHELNENADPTTNEWNYCGIVHVKNLYVGKSFSFLFDQLKLKLKILQIISRTAYSATILVYNHPHSHAKILDVKKKKNANETM